MRKDHRSVLMKRLANDIDNLIHDDIILLDPSKDLGNVGIEVLVGGVKEGCLNLDNV